MERYRLSQSVPWSQNDRIGFLGACLGAGVSLTLLAHLINGPGEISEPKVFGYVAFSALGLNHPLSPIKRLHWSLQYAVCIGIVATLGSPKATDSGVLGAILFHTIIGACWFWVFRVNWWFYWDNPSRRTLFEKIAATILYTGIPVLGLVSGIIRAFGVGVLLPTTTFVEQEGKVVEMLPEHPALAAHARRMEAIRAARSGSSSGRTTASNKDAVCGSI